MNLLFVVFRMRTFINIVFFDFAVKEMVYIDSIKGITIALIIFIVAVIYIPGVGPSTSVENIRTISTFLFAILAGFFISRLNSRYNELRRLVSDEDALCLSLYKISETMGKKISDEIRERLDDYYIVAYDFVSPGEAYKESIPYFMRIWQTVIEFKEKSSEAYKRMLQILTDIEKARNLSSTIYSEKISYGQWIILLSLSGIIIFSIFYLKVDTLYSQIITVLLSSILVLVLLITRDLQNLMFGGGSLLEESGQEVLELIGKKRYYHSRYLKSGRNKVPKWVKEYRVGLHKPGAEKFEIKIVKNKNS